MNPPSGPGWQRIAISEWRRFRGAGHWFALPDEITIKLGLGLGLASRDDPVVARAVLESEF